MDSASDEIARRYWAAEPDPKRLALKVEEAFGRWGQELQRRGWSERIDAARRRYFGVDPDGGAPRSHDIVPGGERGEIDLTQVNHYRSITRGILTLATSARPAFRATASDDTADSMASCRLAEQLWDYELDEGLEASTLEAAERMLVEGEAGILVVWDAMAGPIIAGQPLLERDEDGRPVLDAQGPPVVLGEHPIHEGALVYEVLGPHDVARDVNVRKLRDARWVVVRRVMSRWDLVATYPEEPKRRAIASAGGPHYAHEGSSETRAGDYEDTCYVLELYHASTSAIPGGRFARVVNGETLEQGPLPGGRLPLVHKAPSEVFDHALGYTDTFDLLGLAKLVDAAASNMATTANLYGQRPVVLPEDSDISAADLTGPGVVRVPRDASGRLAMPEWMDVPEIPSSHIQWADWLKSQMQVLSGINDVVRGDPQESLKSGAALALVHAQALQHNSAFQRSYAELLRETAQLVIELYRDNANTERVIDVAGDDEPGTVRAFVGDDLEPVRRIRVELANAMLRTTAGKMEIVDKISDPARFPADEPMRRSQYLGFLASGRLDPITRAGRSEEIGIRAECEALQRGEPVQVLVTDHHAAHIREHKALLDGRARLNLAPEAVTAITTHIMEHEVMWMQLTMTRPALLLATNQQPAPMAPPMPGMPPTGAPANDNAQAPAGEPANDPPQTGEPPIPGTGPAEASMPKAPINPATGERVALTNGAM